VSAGRDPRTETPKGRGWILFACLLALGLVAMEATTLSLAVIPIVRDLGGYSSATWLFSAYLLAQAATAPLFGRMCDALGRRRVLLAGILVFLAGSLLCGLAWDMTSLILFRAAQGIGAGAVQPTVMTIVADLYEGAERARVQGHVASVWAISSVLGPALGGFVADHLTWRLIFSVHLPLGGFALALLWRRFDERPRAPARQPIDVWGAGVFILTAVLAVTTLVHGGVSWPWWSVTTVVLVGAIVGLLVLFARIERRAPVPVLPPWTITSRRFGVGMLAAVLVGALTLGVTAYLPIYVQSVLGLPALMAAAAVGPFNLGWPLGSTLVGRLYLRAGFRRAGVCGGLLVVMGAGQLVLLDGQSSVARVSGACFVLGLGLGVTAAPLLVALQSSVDWHDRGMITATFQVSRSLGSALGVAAFGAVANAAFLSGLNASTALRASGIDGIDEAARRALTDEGTVGTEVRAILLGSSHSVFVALGVVAVALLLVLVWLPRSGPSESGATRAPGPGPART
jgi:MFS family permease